MKPTDYQLDIIMDHINALRLEGEHRAIDILLWYVNVPKTDTTLLLGYLTSTLSAHKHLPYRPEFYEKVRKELRKRKETDKQLEGWLVGLKEPTEQTLEACRQLDALGGRKTPE